MFGRTRKKWWLQQNAFLGYSVQVKEPLNVGEVRTRGSAFLQFHKSRKDYNLSGKYTIESVDNGVVKLKNPSASNGAWSSLEDGKEYTSIGTCSVRGKDDIIGPFVCDYAGTTVILANVVAPSGLYLKDQHGERAINVEVTMRAVAVDMQGNETGDLYETSATIEGKVDFQGTRAVTLRMSLPEGRYKISMWRVSGTIKQNNTSVVDEVKWRDLYYGSDLTLANLGNVTIVKSITNGTDGALAVKSRKLNIKVTRLLPQRIGLSTFSDDLHPTNYAPDIICAICLDKSNGNRTIDEVDVEGIYEVYEKIKSYFGISEACEFNYTFDDENTSFEEMIQSVANATFCTAYRTGEKIKVTDNTNDKFPVMIFNHRNKIPGSESRSVNFGTESDYDGIEYKYIDPADGSQTIYSIPEDKSAKKYKSVQSVGVRTHKQAYLHAWRLYNEMLYKRINVQFTSLAEADLLVVNDRITVSDNTRLAYSEGEVLKQDGLKVHLSGEVRAKAGNYIFFQHWNRTTESIKVVKVEGNVVTLEHAPALDLAADEDNYVNAMYIIEESDTIPKNKQFILSEKDPQSNMKVEVKAINYDERYYANDHDYMNGNNPYSGNQN